MIFSSIVLLLFIISLIGISYYFEQHKGALATKIENILNEKSKGEILFDSISISSLKKFPAIEVTIFNLSINDSLYEKHKINSLFLNEFSASLSVVDIWNETLEIKSITAKRGHVSIFTNEDQYSNAYVFEAKSKKSKTPTNLNIIDHNIDFLMEDIEFSFIEKIKNKKITAHLNNVDFSLDLKKERISKLHLDIFMKEMGLNLKKGTFFNNTRCVGNFKPIINTSEKLLLIPDFSMKIGEQEFDISAFINFKNKKFKFSLSSEKTDFKKSMALLPKNIADKIAIIHIKNPFKLTADISGKFEHNDNTLVSLNYETVSNEVLYKKDRLNFKGITFKGNTKNRVHEDSSIPENKKNLTHTFKYLNGVYNNIAFKINDLTLTNEFSKPLYLNTNYEAEGEINELNTIINSSDYDFSGGDFKIVGKYNGRIKDVSDIINSSELTVKSKRLIVKSKHGADQYKIPNLELNIHQNNAEIKEIIVDLDSKDNLIVKGDIVNFGSLFTSNSINQSCYSEINISSNYLNYQSLLKAFGAHDKKSKSKNISKIKQSINTLGSKFNPTLSFNLKQLDFFNFSFNDISIDALYQDQQLFISELNANYKESTTNGKIKINLNPKKNEFGLETLPIDLNLNATGLIENWAEILNYNKFFFTDAHYKLSVDFKNEARNLREFVNNAEINFNVNKGTLLYKPENINLPFNNISIRLKDKKTILNDFELNLRDNETIRLYGEIDNFIDIFDESTTTKNVSSSINISSNNIDFSNFIDVFSTKLKKSNHKNNIKLILKELHSKFKPTLTLNLKKFSYKNIALKDLSTTLFFNDINTLNLKNTHCLYYDKKIAINAKIDMSKDLITPFKTTFNITDFRIEDLLHSFNNFGYHQLDEPTELKGIIDFDADIEGIMNDSDGINYNSIKAKLTYDIKKLDIKNFQPIIDAGKIVFSKKRLDLIKFADINSSLVLKNNVITIPLTNIQSTAFDFFIEGDLAKTSSTDLWISIPLSNFKKRDLTKVPSTKSFNEAGRKIYLEVRSKEEHGLGYKIHLSEKKNKNSSKN